MSTWDMSLNSVLESLLTFSSDNKRSYLEFYFNWILFGDSSFIW